LEDWCRHSSAEEVGSYRWQDNLPVSSTTTTLSIEDNHFSTELARAIKALATSQIRENGCQLQTFRQIGIVEGLIDQAAELSLNTELFSRIQSWATSSDTQTIWIQGYSQTAIPSRNTLTGAYIVSIAHNAKIPVIAYFCQHPMETRRSPYVSKTNQRDAVARSIHMVCSLISQLLELLPAGIIESEIDLGHERFASIFSTSESLPIAISLLRDSISIGPQLLFCIIDGLQWVEQEKQDALRPLVNMLKWEPRDNRVLKVLYSTDGFVDVLRDLESADRLDVLDFEVEDAGDRRSDGVEMGFFKEL
jgi:hypothetical protein